MVRRITFLRDMGVLLLAWVFLHVLRRDLLKRTVWILREKRNEARDNGYHFFRYLKENHPEIDSYYVITPDSPDRHKVEPYGNLIWAESFRHCLYFLAATYSISSQPYGAFPFHFGTREMNLVQKLCPKKQKVVFLQHGIIKDELPLSSFHRDCCNIDYFVCSAEREYTFVKNTYGYQDKEIGCVGLARFDHLLTAHKEEKTILVMPTWRQWLSCASPENLPTEKELEDFAASAFYRAYADLLGDEELLSSLRAHQYKLVFYLHYKLQPFTALFAPLAKDVVVIADREHYDVQELLMSSKALITDYSSVYFDFAYMNKPVIYYQFDQKDFYAQHYAKGYFSYENDGFGPCFEESEPLKAYVAGLLREDCSQPSVYEDRVNTFFTLRDGKSCERTFDALCDLQK